MKKLFAILAVMGVLTLGSVQPVMAQDAAPAQTEQTTEAAVVEEGGGLHKELKTKFIEGDASFMSLVAIALVLGLAFCIELHRKKQLNVLLHQYLHLFSSSLDNK